MPARHTLTLLRRREAGGALAQARQGFVNHLVGELQARPRGAQVGIGDGHLRRRIEAHREGQRLASMELHVAEGWRIEWSQIMCLQLGSNELRDGVVQHALSNLVAELLGRPSTAAPYPDGSRRAVRGRETPARPYLAADASPRPEPPVGECAEPRPGSVRFHDRSSRSLSYCFRSCRRVQSTVCRVVRYLSASR